MRVVADNSDDAFGLFWHAVPALMGSRVFQEMHDPHEFLMRLFERKDVPTECFRAEREETAACNTCETKRVFKHSEDFLTVYSLGKGLQGALLDAFGHPDCDKRSMDCETCKKKTEHDVFTSNYEAGDIIILNVPKPSWHRLHMLERTLTLQDDEVYTLNGIVAKRGNHYVAWRRNGNDWVLCDDDRVLCGASDKEIIQPYLLFYVNKN